MAMFTDDPMPRHERYNRKTFGPAMLDSEIRQIVELCWMQMPPERQNLDEVEKEIRRLVARAFRQMREDELHS